MINSNIHNSSAMSTEDGSSSTVYGGPQHQQQQQMPPSYTRQPLYDYNTHRGATSPVNKQSVGVTKQKLSGQQDELDGIHPSYRHSGSPRLYNYGSAAAAHDNAHGNRTVADDFGMNYAYSTDARPSPVPSLRQDTPALPSSQSHTRQVSQHQPKALTEESTQTMLEAVLPVSTKLPTQEAQTRPLGVYVRTGRGGPNGVSRLVLVRLTDPADPFFLYELELLEDDYGAFKQRLELLVDFHGFPRYLVNMLRGVAEGTSPYEISFALHAAGGTGAGADVTRGTLRVLETTEFKTVEHISLVLLRQGDAGLKKYLAERFQFYEKAFRCEEAARAAVTAELQAQVELLQSERDDLRDTLRRRGEEMRFASSDAEKEQLAALNRLRDQHTKETNALRESYEKKLETHSRALEEKTQQLRDTTEEKDAALAKLRARVVELEASVTSLQSQLRSAQDTEGVHAKELETLRELNDELANFKAEATKAMSENELNYVTLTERLRGTSAALHNREEKVAALQAHYEKQDDYIRILADQNKQQADRVREAEKNLEKAHHIIANQLQTIKNAKDRYHIAADQLRSQEALLQEREGTVRRQQDEVSTAQERIHELLRKNNELRDQLEKTNDAREQLVSEVKQTQQALLRLQQSTSINGRHWGVLSGGSMGGSAISGGGGYRSGLTAGLATNAAGATPAEERYGTTTSSGVPADLMREFGAHAHVAHSAAYRSASPGVGVGATSRYAPLHTTGSSASPGPSVGPSLFTAHTTYAASSVSPSPAQSSQDRAGSSETAGLTEPHGRTSTSSYGKTEPSPPASNGHPSNTNPPASSSGVSRRAPPLVRSVSLDKPSASAGAGMSENGNNIKKDNINSNNTARSTHSELAMKSFFKNDATQSPVTVGSDLESAYF